MALCIFTFTFHHPYLLFGMPCLHLFNAFIFYHSVTSSVTKEPGWAPKVTMDTEMAHMIHGPGHLGYWGMLRSGKR